MRRDCQPAAAAARRRDAWTIHPIRAARTAAPSRIQGQIGVEPESVPVAPGEAAGAAGSAEAVTVAVAVTVALAVGVLVTVGIEGPVGVPPVGAPVGVAVAEAALLARLPAASWAALPHPAARHPVARMTAGRNRPFVKDRMSSPSVLLPSASGPQDPGEMVR